MDSIRPVTAEEIGYEEEILENLSVEDIRKEYGGELLIWISASGSSFSRPEGTYYALLDYKGHREYREKSLPGESANRMMIHGMIDTIRSLKRACQIRLIVPARLGFEAGFRGKGTNVELLQEALRAVREKECRLTVLFFPGGADLIRAEVMAASGRIDERKSAGNRYKDMIWRECLMRVTELLRRRGVDPAVIEEVRALRPME